MCELVSGEAPIASILQGIDDSSDFVLTLRGRETLVCHFIKESSSKSREQSSSSISISISQDEDIFRTFVGVLSA